MMAGLDFHGDAAIVTGAGGGIGRATALALAAHGAAVLVNDASFDAADAVSEEIRNTGGLAVAEGSAVDAPEAATAIVAAAVAAFGRVDILINNAGISRPAAFGNDSDEDIARVMAVNLMGPYALMRAVWPGMRDRGCGRILNTSSSASLGSGISGAYAPSKAGLIGLTKEAAIGGKPHGILVNAIMPTASTPLLRNHPDAAFRNWMERHFRPEQVAALSLRLVSREHDRTGEVYLAGGGLVAKLGFALGRGYFDPALTPDADFASAAEMSDVDWLESQAGVQERFYAIFGRPE
jgi:NAD(P)-dependent dehydrogenase (short-subunit alcohol dehydrogenase family)